MAFMDGICGELISVETAITAGKVIVSVSISFSNSRSTVMESVVIETILLTPLMAGIFKISPPANSLVGNLDLPSHHHIKDKIVPCLVAAAASTVAV